VGWDPDAPVFRGLIGSDEWALELTAAELADFCRLLGQLTEAVQTAAAELMDAERLSCEVESELLWLEAEGYPDAYELRAIVQQGRRGEGRWSAAAVPELTAAVRRLRVV